MTPNIVLLTVGRSNSSVAVRMLGELGWNLGPAADDEFAEHPGVRAINERQLAGLGFGTVAAAKCLDQLAAPWVIKDPRLATTLPHWRPLLDPHRPLLLWLTKRHDYVRNSFLRSFGLPKQLADQRLADCERHFAAWPWSKFKVDAEQLAAAVRLFDPDRLFNPGMAGRWNGVHAKLKRPKPYGIVESYRVGYDWLKDCATIEDWGCGGGYFKTIVPAGRYVGIDGSRTPFADKVVDLADYRSATPGLFLRHVLEHNYRWQRVLANALASFTERMVLVIYTPWAEQTHNTGRDALVGVPVLRFAKADVEAELAGVTYRTAETPAGEHVYFISRGPDSASH